MIWDVIIVGAGPAGSSAAYDLAVAGKKVLVLDKAEFPRDKPCGGGLTVKTLKKIKFSVEPLITKSCCDLEVSAPGFTPVVMHGDQRICGMVNRKEFDAYLLQQATAKGAVFKNGTVKNIRQHKKGVTLVDDEGVTYESLYVIAADGAKSTVRRQTHKRQVVSQGFALEGKIYTENTPSRVVLDLFYIKDGYAWVFPKKDHVNIGIGTFKNTVKLSKTTLLEYAQEKYPKAEIVEIVGHPLGLGRFRQNGGCVEGRVLFVGDALGGVDALLGEGIHNAVSSGQAAAESLLCSKNPWRVRFTYFLKIFKVRIDLLVCEILAKLFYHWPSRGYRFLVRPRVKAVVLKGLQDGLTVSQVSYRVFSGK